GRATPTPPLLAKVARSLHVTIADLVVVPLDKRTLSDLRVQAGLTQAQLAEAIGASKSVVANIEKGRVAYDSGRAKRLSVVYGVRVSEAKSAWENSRATRAARIRHLSS
ncbi:MAG: helix-turn-helix transcriptional regulator, partial [Tomitella sp.]|nr:helix-turn-helix transcriptional regulator [Tomitella sp.]